MPHQLARLEYLEYSGQLIETPVLSTQRMVSIKPICEVLDVRYKRQDERLRKHPILGQLYQLTGTVGADGRRRKMMCLPARHISNWVYSIGDQNRSERQIEIKYSFLLWFEQQLDQLLIPIEMLQTQEQEARLQLLEVKEERLKRKREGAWQRARLLESLRLKKGLTPEAALVERRNNIRSAISYTHGRMNAFPGHELYDRWEAKLNRWQEELREIEIKLSQQYTEYLEAQS